MHKKRHIVLILSTILSVLNILSFAQDSKTPVQSITGSPKKSFVIKQPFTDTLQPQAIDSSDQASRQILQNQKPQSDSIISDTLKSPKKNKEAISAEVVYSAEDSVNISMGAGDRKIFLYGNAKVKFEQIELTADYMEFNMTTNEVYAKGVPNDTTGIMEGLPVFKDATETFNMRSIKYNFKTKKAYIDSLKTKQDEGYLHAEKTRKDEYEHIHLKHGKYTTCDLDEPHFYIALSKAISIPGDKIVSGPAHFVLEGVHIPIGIPFGFFPNTKKSTSGLLIPTYGEEINRGFYLSNGGYYLAINDYLDLRLTGDIFTNGTWGARVGSNYRVRYKYNGNFNLRYFQNIAGEKGLENYSKSTDYAITWSHNQDAKANPNLHYGASVNISTHKFDQNHQNANNQGPRAGLNNALTNTKQSSISLQKNWPNTPFNLTASANHTQNSITESVELKLPIVAFNMNRINPFKFKNSTKERWYEQIQLSYSSFFDNKITTVDTLLFTKRVWEKMNTGFKHEIPISYNYKPKRLKNFTISPSLRYSGVAYTNYIQKHLEKGYTGGDSTVTDTINKISYAHSYLPSISFGLNPKIYGNFDFTARNPDSKLQSIRHVMSPSVSVSFVPDMSKVTPNYYRDLKDENGKLLETYSIFANGMYGTPSLNRRSRTLSASLRNTLEMKVKQSSDTAQKIEKVKLLDNFDFMSNMNFDDSIKWSPISITGHTSILKGKLNISMNGSFDPYAQNAQFRRINKSEYKASGKIGRLTSAGMSTGFSFQSKQGGSSDGESTPAVGSANVPSQQQAVPVQNQNNNKTRPNSQGGYVNFDVPWSVRADYSLNYSNAQNRKDIIQTLRFSGDLSLTAKWKITFSSGYDLKSREITTTDFSIYRDLHCWEMRFTAVPFGYYKNFNFQINVKSAVLQDLKYEKRIPWQDNY